MVVQDAPYTGGAGCAIVSSSIPAAIISWKIARFLASMHDKHSISEVPSCRSTVTTRTQLGQSGVWQCSSVGRSGVACPELSDESGVSVVMG